MAIAFQEHRTESADLTIIQQNIGTLAESICSIPILDGRIVSGLALSTTALVIEHGLGRAPKGWIVISADSNKNPFDDGSSTNVDLFINLKVQAGTNNISLWIF